MATASISVLGLLVLLVVIGLPLLVVFGLTYIAITRKNWGGLALLGLLLLAIPTALLFASFILYSGHEVHVQEAAIVRGEAEAKAASLRKLARQISKQEKQSASTQESSEERLPRETTAEVASDEELASVASAPPKIALDSEIVIGDKTEDVKSDRPDWIDGIIASNQTVIVSGPHIDEESCRSESRAKVYGWIDQHFAERWPNIAGFDSPSLHRLGARVDPSEVIVEEYAETRETTFGDMHLLYTLAEIRPEIEAELSKLFAAEAIRCQQIAGTRTVTLAGAGVLSLVALAHVVLRSGGRRTKNTAS
ncbi:hypothetical protein [Botrimarina mediterranea]|uniref:hypothetical protein n=1 Tax=Botrimarina mediterranea TaxID=2528022 RepID=UPI001189C512|nr:hypothetical protein K2D_45260 [Planctomycetes bacterium K2D]